MRILWGSILSSILIFMLNSPALQQVVWITGPDRGPRQTYIHTYVFYELSYNYANNTSILPYHLQVCITQRIFYCNFFVGIILIAWISVRWLTAQGIINILFPLFVVYYLKKRFKFALLLPGMLNFCKCKNSFHTCTV